jgi:3-oxoacyl-[acyl-carrier-protein] synthase III
LERNSVLEIDDSGAWNGGKLIDNSFFENKGMFFKGNMPVNNKTIEERIGITTRMAAPDNESIGVSAMKNLLETTDINPDQIRLIIGATNLGENKHDPGPVVRKPFELIKNDCPNAIALDLYAGCPGFNVSVELIFMLSLTGFLKKNDTSVVVGAENLHRGRAFKPLDTSNIIFGDDALATSLKTKVSLNPSGDYTSYNTSVCACKNNFIAKIAAAIFELNGNNRIDGIIIDNQLGKLLYRIPASAARVQQAWVELMFPEHASKGTFKKFNAAIKFYNNHINAFAFDIMTLAQTPETVKNIAKSYIQSGKFKTIVSVYLAPDFSADVVLHKGQNYVFKRPEKGIIDTLTITHGCFAAFIQAVNDNGNIYAEIDGKGVFLHATRGAKKHLSDILNANELTMNDIDLLIEHQANFAMIPMTLERVLGEENQNIQNEVKAYIANKMITNIHERGNCSVVCMQRLPYELKKGTLKENVIQGYSVNQNINQLKNAKIILSDSVGSGMTRSSILQKK